MILAWFTLHVCVNIFDIEYACVKTQMIYSEKIKLAKLILKFNLPHLNSDIQSIIFNRIKKKRKRKNAI